MLCVCMYKMGCFRSGRVGDFFVLFLSFEGFVLFGFLFFFFFFFLAVGIPWMVWWL